MSTEAPEAPAVEYSDAAKEMGDKIVTLSLKEAKELSDYFKRRSWNRASRRWRCHGCCRWW